MSFLVDTGIVDQTVRMIALEAQHTRDAVFAEYWFIVDPTLPNSNTELCFIILAVTLWHSLQYK